MSECQWRSAAAIDGVHAVSEPIVCRWKSRHQIAWKDGLLLGYVRTPSGGILWRVKHPTWTKKTRFVGQCQVPMAVPIVHTETQRHRGRKS